MADSLPFWISPSLQDISLPETTHFVIYSNGIRYIKFDRAFYFSRSNFKNPKRHMHTPSGMSVENKIPPPYWVSEICSRNEIWTEVQPDIQGDAITPALTLSGDKSHNYTCRVKDMAKISRRSQVWTLLWPSGLQNVSSLLTRNDSILWGTSMTER